MLYLPEGHTEDKLKCWRKTRRIQIGQKPKQKIGILYITALIIDIPIELYNNNLYAGIAPIPHYSSYNRYSVYMYTVLL